MGNLEGRNIWTEAILIAVVPLISYLFTYSFELGFVSYFGIPFQFIQIAPCNILLMAFLLYFIGSIGVPFILVISQIIPNHMHELANRIWVSTAMATFLYMFSLPLPNKDKFIFFLIFLGLEFLVFVWPLITQSKTKGYHNKLIADDKTRREFLERPGSWYYYLIKKVGLFAIGLIISIFSIAMVLMQYGLFRASKETEYYTLVNNPNKVIIRFYGYQGMCSTFDRSSKIVRGDFSVVNLQSDPTLLIKKERIGPLNAVS